MKTAFKTILLYCLAVVVLFSLVSCERGLGGVTDSAGKADKNDTAPTVTTTQDTIPEITISESVVETTTTDTFAQDTMTLTFDETSGEQTTPVQTIPTDGTSEPTAPEETVPEKTTAYEEITVPEEVTTLEEATTPRHTTITEETTTPELPHEHSIVNGQCVCGFVLVVENTSLYDNDGDGNKDVFCFSSVLPERFTSNNAIHFEAEDFIPDLSLKVGTSFEGGDMYYYCRNDRKSYIVYEIEVSDSGVYEMAIYQRMRDTDVHGAKFIVNEGSTSKYSVATSYQFSTEQALVEVCWGTAMTSYMFGIELELVAGVNYIKIELAPGVENSQYFRDFYLVKTSN